MGSDCWHFYCDQWPGQVVHVAYAIVPCGFGWEPCCRMEVLNCALYTWYLVDVVDCFRCWRSSLVVVGQINVLQHRHWWWVGVQGVDRFLYCGPIDEEGVQVEVYNMGLEWYPPQYCAWSPPPFGDSFIWHYDFSGVATIYVDLLPISYLHVAWLRKFSSAEKGLIVQLWDYVYSIRRLSDQKYWWT